MEVDSRVIRLLDCDFRIVETQSVVKTDEGVIVLNESATSIMEFVKKQSEVGIGVSIMDIVEHLRSAFDMEKIDMEEVITDVKTTIDHLQKVGLIIIDGGYNGQK